MAFAPLSVSHATTDADQQGDETTGADGAALLPTFGSGAAATRRMILAGPFRQEMDLARPFILDSFRLVRSVSTSSVLGLLTRRGYAFRLGQGPRITERNMEQTNLAQGGTTSPGM